MERFREKGLPHKRIEAWHYSDLRGVVRDVPALAPVPDDKAVQRARVLLEQAGAPLGRRVVLLDGYLSDDLSDLSRLPAGLSISSLAAAMLSGDKRAEKTRQTGRRIGQRRRLAQHGLHDGWRDHRGCWPVGYRGSD